MTSKWPHRCLDRVPTRKGACRLAQTVRASTQPHDPVGVLGDLRELCRVGRFRIVERELSGARGGVEAMLLPQAANRFRIWVDPTPPGGWNRINPTVRSTLRRHRLRFRVAHEIAHSFFYQRDGGVPRRAVPDSPEQEDFADAFARALLIPTDAARATRPTAQDVVALHERYDVSLQVAVRAVTEMNPGLSAALLYWPSGSPVAESTATLQWCTSDLRHSWRDVASAMRGGYWESGLPTSGSIILWSRRQLLWVDSTACRLVAHAPG